MKQSEEFKNLSILHYSMCFGALMITILLHFLIKPISFTPLELSNDLLVLIGVGIGATNLFLHHFIFQKMTTSIDHNSNASQTSETYRQAYIIKWALLEGAVLINAMLYFFVTHNSLNIIVALILLIVLFLNKPQ